MPIRKIASPAATSAAPTFVSANRVYREHGVHPRRLAIAALSGLVRVVIEPGRTPRYAVEDVASLIERERGAGAAAAI